MEVFSTRGIAPSQRLTQWNNRISERLIAVDIDARRDFLGTMRTCQVGKISITAIKGDETVIQTSADGLRRNRAASSIGISFQEARTARFRVGSKERVVDAYEFILLDFASPFRSETGSDGKAVFVVSLPASEILTQCPNAMDRIGKTGTARQGVGALLRSFARSCLTYPQNSNAQELSEMLTNLALMSVEGLSPDQDQPLTRNRLREEAIRLIDRSICDPDLNTHYLADKLGVTPRYVQMLFADITESPSSFIRLHRLNKAREAVLEDDGRKISDIAFDVGFNDLSLFNRSFKARFGTTPTKLRGRAN